MRYIYCQNIKKISQKKEIGYIALSIICPSPTYLAKIVIETKRNIFVCSLSTTDINKGLSAVTTHPWRSFPKPHQTATIWRLYRVIGVSCGTVCPQVDLLAHISFL